MPIDYAENRKKLESELGGLLDSQYAQVPIQGQNTLSSIKGARNSFLGQLALPSNNVARAMPKLNRNIESAVADNSFSQKIGLLKQKFNYYFNLAQDYGLDTTAAVEYARKKSALDNQQAFTAQQSVADRESANRIQDIKRQYGQAAIDTANQYQNKIDPMSALIRILSGVGVGAATGWAMNKAQGSYNQNNPITQPQQTMNPQPQSNYPNELNMANGYA